MLVLQFKRDTAAFAGKFDAGREINSSFPGTDQSFSDLGLELIGVQIDIVTDLLTLKLGQAGKGLG